MTARGARRFWSSWELGAGHWLSRRPPVWRSATNRRGQSGPQETRLTNLGNQNLVISMFGTSGTGLSQFTIQADPSCPIGHAVAPGASCTFDVTFTPTAVGPFQAEIDVFDDSGNVQGAEQVIPLTGTGASPAPIVNLLPAQLTFGDQAAGTVSA